MKSESHNKQLQEATEIVTVRWSGGDKTELAEAVKRLAYLERRGGFRELAVRHYEEAAAICGNLGDVLGEAHAIRHAGDIHLELDRRIWQLLVSCGLLNFYRNCSTTNPLDLANAIRGMALNREAVGDIERAKLLWSEAREIYLSLGVEAGVAECDTHLSQRNQS